MKIQTAFTFLAIATVGCHQEPTTLRGQAEQAQEELADAREDAAEMVANSEENAVDQIADAREDAQEKIQRSKRKAVGIVEDAKSNLTRKLDRLEDTGIPDATNPASDDATAEDFSIE